MNTDNKLSQDEINQISTIFNHRIRHALMNDLGLSRDFVREESRKIIDDAIKKAVNSLLDGGYIKQVVNNYLTANSTLIRSQVNHQVTELLKEKLSISIKP